VKIHLTGVAVAFLWYAVDPRYPGGLLIYEWTTEKGEKRWLFCHSYIKNIRMASRFLTYPHPENITNNRSKFDCNPYP
jgi:hypothetical protein